MDLGAARRAITCLPGRGCAAIDPPRTRQGEILIPETVEDRLRPDFGTWIAGEDKGISIGERVLVRPYRGLWLADFEHGEFSADLVRFYGVTHTLEDDICMAFRDGQWQPLYNWVLIRRAMKNERESGLILTDRGAQPNRCEGDVILSGPSSEVSHGDHIFFDPNPRLGLTFKFGDMGEDVFLMREVDEDAFRRIWMVSQG